MSKQQLAIVEKIEKLQKELNEAGRQDDLAALAVCESTEANAKALVELARVQRMVMHCQQIKLETTNRFNAIEEKMRVLRLNLEF